MVLISLEKWERVNFNENLSKCFDQILLLTKLKEKQLLGVDVEEKEEEEGKEREKWLGREGDKPRSPFRSLSNVRADCVWERLEGLESIILTCVQVKRADDMIWGDGELE